MIMSPLTQRELKSILDYNPDSGVFYWKINKNSHAGKVKSGCIAGSLRDQKSGYIRIVINGKKYYAHRLAFLYVYGSIPRFVDHKNGDTTDNRIDNLRSTTILENSKNLKVRKSSVSGVTGVTYSRRDNLWISSIRINYKNIQKQFKCFLDAVSFRKSMELKLGYSDLLSSREGTRWA